MFTFDLFERNMFHITKKEQKIELFGIIDLFNDSIFQC